MSIKAKHSPLVMMLMSFVFSAFILFVVALFEANAQTGYTFCDGWREGYKAGYCYREYSCIPPIAPICPVPDIGMSSYQDGYNRGFMRGIRDKR